MLLFFLINISIDKSHIFYLNDIFVVFFSLIFWGWVLGPVGMFMAVPLSMTIMIALESHPSTKTMAILLSSIDKRDNNE